MEILNHEARKDDKNARILPLVRNLNWLHAKLVSRLEEFNNDRASSFFITSEPTDFTVMMKHNFTSSSFYCPNFFNITSILPYS